MEKIVNINDDLKIKEIKKRNYTRISVIDGNKEIVLSNMKTSEYFWNKYVFNEFYIVSYSRGCMVNNIPLNIEAAYSIKDKRLIDLSNKRIGVLLEYMLIGRRGFDIANVLSEINDVDLGILEDIEKEDLSMYLTAGNNQISHDEIVSYILNEYPVLCDYTKFDNYLSVLEYKKIQDELDEDTFWFYIIPQDLSLVDGVVKKRENLNSTDYRNIYISEYNTQQKILSLKKK